MLFVPAVNDRLIKSAVTRPADALVIDLEDSVPHALKAEARSKVGGLANTFSKAGYGVAVRVNRSWRCMVRDIESSVSSHVAALVIPKVPNGAHVRAVAEVILECELEKGLRAGHTELIALIEDAEGLANMSSIARAHPRLQGMNVGPEDLAVALRMTASEDGLYTHNVLAISACRLAGITPVGFIGSMTEFADKDAFERRMQRAARLGFESSFCIHPNQIDAINSSFMPSKEAFERAQALVKCFEEACAGGNAACVFEGLMVDIPVANGARLLIEKYLRMSKRPHGG
ncbi:MAG: CoA ester lyase [Pusillimonas sp.]